MNVDGGFIRRDSDATFVIRCMGRFRLEDRFSEIQVRNRKGRAVLAALALSGHSMPREALADLLWSDRAPDQARSSLRQVVYELQKSDDLVSVIEVRREELAIRAGHAVTDLQLIQRATEDGDWSRLLAHLHDSGTGLLTDLDDLDPEFDTWLRIERVHEPARTLSSAVEAAERCLLEQSPRMALNIASAVLHLDPVDEVATRLAMRADHVLGDKRALHDHFNSLSARLRQDYETEPSAETTALLAKLVQQPASQVADMHGPVPAHAGAGPPPPTGLRKRHWAVPAAAAVGLAAAAGWMFVSSAPQPRGSEPLVIAVLPFEEQGSAPSYIADGLWDDTRAALSRNPELRVLGRATVASAVQQRLSPEQYYRRFGVGYLLQATVRHSGEQVLVSVSLTATADGRAVWEDSFPARLGDPFALQSAVAQGIEGKIRGRLARGGGRRADQIATSPQVYALYTEARTLMRERERGSVERAKALLRDAVRRDPNFAPAWSSLASAIYFSRNGLTFEPGEKAEAVAALRNALSIAPNLAEAHATLANITLRSSPEAERELRKAVQLDPSYAEAWNWLGILLHDNYRYHEAIGAFERAAEIDPLWVSPVPNIVWAGNESGDRAAVARLFHRLEQAGASREMVVTARAEDLLDRGDYSSSVQALMTLGRDAQGSPAPAALLQLNDLCLLLDDPEAAARLSNFPAWYGPMVRGEQPPPTALNGQQITPQEFWSTISFTPFAVRAMVRLGRTSELLGTYRAVFRSTDDFVSRTQRGSSLVYLAPSLAVALRSEGRGAEAEYVLAAAEREATKGLRATRGSRQAAADLALIKSAQGEREESLRLLGLAVRRNWLPDGRRHPMDIAREPAFAMLRGDNRFEATRRRILDHVANERAELHALKLGCYPVS